MTKLSIWEHLGDISESYVADAMPPSWQAPAASSAPAAGRGESAVSRFLSNGWIAAVLSVVVAVAVIAAIVWAGQMSPVTPPAGSVPGVLDGESRESETRPDRQDCTHGAFDAWYYVDENFHDQECPLCGAVYRAQHDWALSKTENGESTYTCQLCAGTKIVAETETTPSGSTISTNVWNMTLTPLPDPLPNSDPEWPTFPLRYLQETKPLGDGYAARNDNLYALDWANVSAYSSVVETFADWQAFCAPSDPSDADTRLIATYDEAFFETHALLVIIREHGTGSLRYTDASATVENGVLEVKLATYCPNMVTDDMAYRLILLPVERSAADLPIRVEVTSVTEYID